MQYSSRDFGKTGAALGVDLPDKLLHRDVESMGTDNDLNRQRRHPVYVVDLPSRTISVTIGLLEPGQTTSRHRHTYETILYVLEGQGCTIIEDRHVEWRAGDAVYIPVWAWHQHVNASDTARCRYVACENAPLLQNLAAAIRQEDGDHQ